MSDSRVTEPIIAVERNLPGELVTRDKDMLDLMQDAPFRAAHLAEAADRVVKLYEDSGKKDKAAEWRKKVNRTPESDRSDRP